MLTNEMIHVQGERERERGKEKKAADDENNIARSFHRHWHFIR